ncbi:uncharacterized protein DEA37_0009708 [Paragonimus westermani]|uniref:G-protein coupled receptors family 1 profile domain-containing protein n=1 Tax=Paragonimus westermani TaxID=34504 RepID=A0A5J4NBR1_9TREM|nr:uncharacterized protein DEA37_0009708 [Paragonimus westermani]
MQFFMIILDLILLILSGRGGTMEVTKRSKVPVVLTILFVLSFVEIPIHAVNIYFATTYLAACQKPVIAAFIAGNAIRLLHILQCYIWLGAHFRKSGAFWSRLAYEDRPMLKGSIHHNTNIATKRQAQEMLSNSVRRRLTRLAMLGKSKCSHLKHQDADEQTAISSAAALFSEVFYVDYLISPLKDVNLVVSDIATGLLLLRWQTNQWVGCGHRVPISSIERESVPFNQLARPTDPIGQPVGSFCEYNQVSSSAFNRFVLNVWHVHFAL